METPDNQPRLHINIVIVQRVNLHIIMAVPIDNYNHVKHARGFGLDGFGLKFSALNPMRSNQTNYSQPKSFLL